MQGIVLLGKAGGCSGIDVVQFAYRLDTVTSSLQCVPPTGDTPVVAHGVVPIGDVMHPAPCSQRGPCGDADGRGCEGLGESRATGSQGINYARNVWHQPLEKIARFPNGIDTEHYNRRPQRGSFPGFQKRDGEIVVGTIADLRSVKNLPRLLRAVAAADVNIRLAIVGEGPDRDVIMAQATRLGIADRVMMPGYLRDPARYIRLFDIFALSSDSEQYPVSLVEAMTSALPIVSTDVGDVRNIVSRENRPFIVARDDEGALASAIASLAKDAALRATLATANRILACSQYDEYTMFARYRQLYGSAMKRADFARQS